MPRTTPTGCARSALMEFLRDVGKHFTVNYMLQKESVKARMDAGISFTEFAYMLLQAYDFWSCTGGTAASCRSAAATSGATSPPASS